MSKNIAKDEIDLLNVIVISWKKKFQILLIIVLALTVTFISHKLAEPKKIKASTEIRPISVYDEAEYKIYNSIINTIKPYYVIKKSNKVSETSDSRTDVNYKIVNTSVKKLEINNIDKTFLLELFIDRINEKSNLIKSIKEFGLIKEENYSSKIEFEEAVTKLASSIELTVDDDTNFIKIKSYNLDKWENFLEFIEKETNLEIQNKLTKMFDNYIRYVETTLKFEIEDIDTQLSVTDNEYERLELLKKKDIINANKYIERMQDIFQTSPIIKSDNFYAAKIIYNSTTYDKGRKTPLVTKLIASAILAGIFGIFFVVTSNAINNRK